MNVWLGLIGLITLGQFIRLLMMRRPVLWDLIAAFLLPALLMLCATNSRNPQSSPEQLRVFVSGVHANTASLRSAPLRIGGDVDGDDLVVPGAGAGELTATLTDERIDVRVSGDPDAPTVVGVPRRDWVVFRSEHYLGETPFAPGDSLCVEACDSGQAQWFRLSADGRRLEAAGGLALPAFPERPLYSLPGARLWPGVLHWGAEQRVYPLWNFGAPDLAAPPHPNQPCEAGRFVCVHGHNGDLRPARSFLFHSGLFSPAWHAALMDPQAEVRRADGEIVRVSDLDALPKAASTLALRLHVLRLADSEARATDPDQPASRLSKGVDVTLASHDGLDARLAGRHVQVVQRADLPVLVQGASQPARSGALVLPEAGGESGRAVSGCLAFGRSEPCTMRGLAWSGALSSPSCGERCTQIGVEKLPFPSLPVWVALAWAIVGGWSLARTRPGAAVVCVAATMQLLLALRVIVAAEGVWLDPQLNWRALMAASVVAYVAVPCVLLRFTATRPSGPLQPAALVAFVAAVLICAMKAYRPAGFATAVPVFLAAVPLFQAVLPLSIEWMLRLARKPLKDTVPRPEGLQGRREASTAPYRAWPWGPTILLAAFVARVLVRFGGVSERLPLSPPFDIAVSVFYVPVLICGFALTFCQAARSRSRAEARFVFAIVGLIALDVVFAPALARDLGFAIYACPLVGMAAAMVPGAARRLERPLAAWVWAAPALLIALAAGGLLGWAQTNAARAADDLRYAASASRDQDPEVTRRLEHAAVVGQNERRIFNLMAPQRLALSGSQGAQATTDWSADLADYTARDLGYGWMTPSDLGGLRDVQLSDNVSAIHLMAPFGRIAGAWLLGALCLAAMAYDRKVEGWDDWRNVAGRLAMWWVFAAAAYMVLANLQLAPFTGRDIYWLAAASNSDLAEGALLFLFALVAGRIRAPEAPNPP